ncbi:MAG: DUF58 domain-containing protein, partial [Anaerolineales bacterium]
INSEPKCQLNVKLLPFLVILFAALYALTGYRGWLAFLIGCGGAWLLGAVWIHILEQDLSLVRRVDFAWAQVGESIPEQLLIINKSRLPLAWLEIVDESEQLVEPVRLVTDVEPQVTRRRTLNHTFKRRGIYTLGPTRLRTSDPLGIYTLTLHSGHVSTILVTPPQIPLPQLHIPLGGQADGKQHHFQTLNQQISEAGIRDYMPGDSLRRIHWHTSAHSDALMVKQLEAAASEDWWVLADLDASVQAGVEWNSTIELVIVLAASLITRGLKEHHRVGLMLAGPKLVRIEPRSGPAQRWNMLCALAAAKPGDRPISDLLILHRSVRRGSIIVVTPTCDPLWVASAGVLMHDRKIEILLVNPAEFGRPANQGQVSALLSKIGIPYSIMPRTLLEEAYSSSRWKNRKQPNGIEARKRFMEQDKSNWRSID